jgi:dynein heavy chain
MDERHWWIAGRISQAFSIDSSSGFLEKFICEASNLEKINTFLCTNGSNKLFFCGVKGELAAHYSNITVCDNLLKLVKEDHGHLDDLIILYFIRHDTIQEVSQTQIFKEVFCGEIRNVSQILFNVYSDLLLTMFESNKSWSESKNDSGKLQSIRNMEKYVNAISEFSSDNQNLKNMVR